MIRSFCYLILMIIIFAENANAQNHKYDALFRTVSSVAKKIVESDAKDMGCEGCEFVGFGEYRKVSTVVCYSWDGSIKSAANVDVYITQDGLLKVKCNDQYYDMKPNYSYDSNSTNPDQYSYYKYFILIGSSKFYLNY